MGVRFACAACGAQYDLPSQAGRGARCLACGTELRPAEEPAPAAAPPRPSRTRVPVEGETRMATPKERRKTAPPPSAPPPSSGDGELPVDSLFAGRYRILGKPVGRGAMGTVYRASDPETESTVALKVLSPEASGQPALREALRQEVRLARGISHPNLLRIHGFSVTPEGQPYVEMEFVEGEDLEVLRRRKGGRLDEVEVRRIFASLLDGLAHLHDRGVVHRDLKPRNVMVTPRGDVKILDYGIASSLRDQVSAGRVDSAGTPAYMSPEQIRGEACDPRSDVYACGMMMLHLVEGELPFDGRSPQAAVRFHLGDVVPGSSRASKPMNEVIARCLQRRPGARYPTAAALREALVAVDRAPKAPERKEDRSDALRPLMDRIFQPQPGADFVADVERHLARPLKEYGYHSGGVSLLYALSLCTFYGYALVSAARKNGRERAHKNLMALDVAVDNLQRYAPSVGVPDAEVKRLQARVHVLKSKVKASRGRTKVLSFFLFALLWGGIALLAAATDGFKHDPRLQILPLPTYATASAPSVPLLGAAAACA